MPRDTERIILTFVVPQPSSQAKGFTYVIESPWKQYEVALIIVGH